MKDTIQLIASLESGQTLSTAEAFELQSAILAGSVSTPHIVSIFEALQKRRISKEEFGGFFRASVRAMTPLSVARPTLDTCGTGGDNSGSFNISTVSAVVCSTAGVPVAKHGNRAASSRCGSADVLEALGVRIDLTPEQAEHMLESCGFVFLFARNFHPAFKHVAEARKTFGKRTYFNLLGPLLNPAKALYRVHGLSDPTFTDMLGDILIESGVKKAWLVHAEDGLDEISPASVTRVVECAQGKESHSFVIEPKEFDMHIHDRNALKGDDVAVNAEIMTRVLKGKGSDEQNFAVILNAAAGLTVYGTTRTFAEGVTLASEIIASGRGYEQLQKIITISNNV